MLFKKKNIDYTISDKKKKSFYSICFYLNITTVGIVTFSGIAQILCSMIILHYNIIFD